MPKLDLEAIPQVNTTGYPPPYDREVGGRWYRRLAPVSGLSEFRASHCVLKPGAWSSQRHWHMLEDELLVMVSGEAVLVEDEGETVLRAGDVAVWAKGVANGHNLQNRSDTDCAFVVVSGGDAGNDHGEYSDIDMKFTPGGYVHKDGSPYADTKRSP